MSDNTLLVSQLRERAEELMHESHFSNGRWTLDLLLEAADVIEETSAPIPLVIHCPKCGVQHVDVDDETGAWATARHHRKHFCKPADGGCGLIFQPANGPTVGVLLLPLPEVSA